MIILTVATVVTLSRKQKSTSAIILAIKPAPCVQMLSFSSRGEYSNGPLCVLDLSFAQVNSQDVLLKFL